MIRSGNCRIGIGSSLRSDIKHDEVVVVIDNLRASSTIVTALALGIEKIIPVVDDREAFTLKEQGAVIAGESGCIKIAGYDIGNSPVELSHRFQTSPFTSLVLKTSNLIPLLVSLPHALICSSLNMASIAAYCTERNACILAAGGERGVTEDLGVAFALAAHLSKVPFDKDSIVAFTRESRAAQYLCEIGYADDVAFISRVNVYDIIPMYDGGVIKRL